MMRERDEHPPPPKFDGGWDDPPRLRNAAPFRNRPSQVTGSLIMTRPAIAGSLKLGRPVSM